MPKILPYSSQACIARFSHSGRGHGVLGGRSGSPLSFHSGAGSQRPGAVKGRARFLGAAERTLDGEDRCETITGGRKDCSFPFCSPTTESEFPEKKQENSIAIERTDVPAVGCRVQCACVQEAQ